MGVDRTAKLAVIADEALLAARAVFDGVRASPEALDRMATWMTDWIQARGVRARVGWSGNARIGVTFTTYDLEPIHTITVNATINT